ncbi:MAG TPA: signal recognition particle protein, partial [Chthonomonadales bacterium]|nr:signal recognition particle protein [Chthonomonadales bacterium]
LEQFHPDRMASRILGMGDILSLIERAQEAFDEKQAEELEQKLLQKRYDLNDFLDQLQQMKRMGPVENILKMLPGKVPAGFQLDPKLLPRKEAIVRSMTPAERRNPSLLNGARRRRIADGCGQPVHEVNLFLNEFDQMKKMIETMLAREHRGRKMPAAMRTLKKMPKAGRSSGWKWGSTRW